MKHYLNKIKLAGAGKNIAAARKAQEVSQESEVKLGKQHSVSHSRTARGGGGGASGPIYRPPKLGDMQYGASFSFLETLDLVSDGPIEGVVNQQGRLVNDDGELLQGVYLDDTPVAV
ncbi:MAG TPA: hypothetical protein DEG69_05810, partial [Flavobacteriaceae bacterium]|nr:hypothetical protein [Flavobacteriaceae bacterium]